MRINKLTFKSKDGLKCALVDLGFYLGFADAETSSRFKMSDTSRVSPTIGQEMWAAVSVVFCVAVILVFFFILCCAYRRHRRVRDISTPPREELGNYTVPWVLSRMKDSNVENKTSGV